MKKSYTVLVLLYVLIVSSCSNVLSDAIDALSTKGFLTFTFPAALNDGMNVDVEGEINHSTKIITLTVPPGTDRSALIPEFTFAGYQVTVTNIVQVSGQGEQDFTAPIEYRVIAGDTTFVTYSVQVVEENSGEF